MYFLKIDSVCTGRNSSYSRPSSSSVVSVLTNLLEWLAACLADFKLRQGKDFNIVHSAGCHRARGPVLYWHTRYTPSCLRFKLVLNRLAAWKLLKCSRCWGLAFSIDLYSRTLRKSRFLSGQLNSQSLVLKPRNGGPSLNWINIKEANCCVLCKLKGVKWRNWSLWLCGT